MTQNVYAARELIERELERYADDIDGGTAKALVLLPTFTMLTLALDILNKAIAFDDEPVKGGG